jgi:methylase of polypeptide subunit release factors
MSNLKVSKHYDKNYFGWQASLGEFGGWANLSKFVNYITPKDTVLDFGCGGGYLLKNINCKRKVGVEVNHSAVQTAKKNGIQVYQNVENVPDASIDVIISNTYLATA